MSFYHRNIEKFNLNDFVDFNPKEYSYNLFWQTNKHSKQKIYSIISNYLSTMNEEDVKTLCSYFGKNLVKSVLEDKYKNMYKKGYISTNGMDIPLNGSFEENPIYKKLLRIINDL